MRRFHLVAVTPDFARTLVIRTATGWLLPWVDDSPHGELPLQVDAMLSSLVSGSDMVHEAPLPSSTADRVVPGYCLAVTSGALLSNTVTFVPNGDLASTPAVLSLQRLAWSLAMERLQAPTADFDSSDRVTAALAWAEHQVVVRQNLRVLSMTRHRCSRHEYVVRLDTTGGAMYFKGGRERVADEGVLTRLLHELAPNSVPDTIAIDVIRGGWLYRELPGASLVGPTLTLSAAVDVIPALAALQQRALAASAVHEHLASRCLAARDLFDTVDGIVEAVLARDSVHDVQLLERWRFTRDAMAKRCELVDREQLPQSVVLSDFWPRNVLRTEHGVGFIDLERCYWSYPFLSLWRFIREAERSLQTGGEAHSRIEAAFIQAWAHVIPAPVVTRALAELPLLGRLFELLLAWNELNLRERDLGSPLSADYRAMTMSRHVCSLFGGFCRASASMRAFVHDARH